MAVPLRVQDAFAAAGSLYHIVALSAVFRVWPSWADEILLQWLLRQATGEVFADLEASSAEYRFFREHIAGMLLYLLL
jgi:hypothetical protein